MAKVLIINAENPDGYNVETPDKPTPPHEPTPEERLSALESAVLAMMGGGQNV